jgi:hypothetical protein
LGNSHKEAIEIETRHPKDEYFHHRLSCTWVENYSLTYIEFEYNCAQVLMLNVEVVEDLSEATFFDPQDLFFSVDGILSFNGI